MPELYFKPQHHDVTIRLLFTKNWLVNIDMTRRRS